MILLYKSSTPGASEQAALRDADVARWLTCGGDERIVLDARGRNRYGCGALPEPGTTSFSSSTASILSAGAFRAARDRLEALAACGSEREAYPAAMAEVRRRLAGLCGLSASGGENIILGASGTDLHLFAVDLARGDRQIMSVMADASESGRGVANALCSRRYAAASPHGVAAVVGEPLGEPGCAGFVTVPLREVDGALRDAQVVDEAFEAAVGKAVTATGAVLLVLLDVSKTGLVAPSAACAVRLKRRYGAALTVMVDACQFRLSTESLAGYLAQGFLVAITGSKFVGGPPFSGALIVPDAELERLRATPLTPALGDYSARGDWPAGFVSRNVLPDAQNRGLLLRWEAALFELAAFRQLSDQGLCAALDRIAAVTRASLAANGFEALPVSRVRRFGRDGWDARPTLFPFLVRNGCGLFDAEQTQRLYQGLSDGDATGRILLGQPVPIGRRAGKPVSALRLAISARQLVQAINEPGGAEALERQIRRTFDVVAADALDLP
ncbi:hypothetical protein LJR225_002241 [Phenylobacterium sp. LjRoot225]|uniref:hypothetical protein n=1 Tax=Phenylobacterium sp. LjRoot225 TaxID=3342285 RepID=UPI003ECD734D